MEPYTTTRRHSGELTVGKRVSQNAEHKRRMLLGGLRVTLDTEVIAYNPGYRYNLPTSLLVTSVFLEEQSRESIHRTFLTECLQSFAKLRGYRDHSPVNAMFTAFKSNIRLMTRRNKLEFYRYKICITSKRTSRQWGMSRKAFYSYGLRRSGVSRTDARHCKRTSPYRYIEIT